MINSVDHRPQREHRGLAIDIERRVRRALDGDDRLRESDALRIARALASQPARS